MHYSAPAQFPWQPAPSHLNDALAADRVVFASPTKDKVEQVDYAGDAEQIALKGVALYEARSIRKAAQCRQILLVR